MQPINCHYPLCTKPAMWTPVVEVPTVRTVGVIKPQLTHLIHSPSSLMKGQFSRNMIIYQFEQQMLDYKANRNELTKTAEPTYLIGREVCQSHKETYNLFNWIRKSEWRVMREAAHTYGFHLPSAEMVIVKFHPLGWKHTHGGRLELVRDRMAKED